MSSRPPASRMSNIEFVAELMQFSRYGALAQLFVMEALIKYSAVVSTATDPSPYTSALFDGRLWIECARDIKRQIDAFYDRDVQSQQSH